MAVKAAWQAVIFHSPRVLPVPDPFAALREALRLSPDNIPLRQHLADSLLGSGQPEGAEEEYRSALALAPQNAALKLGLARAFMAQQKDSAALVIVEARFGVIEYPCPMGPNLPMPVGTARAKGPVIADDSGIIRPSARSSVDQSD